jgi:hypothetical protein
MGFDLPQTQKIPWKSGAFSAAFIRGKDAGFSWTGPEGRDIHACDAAINGRSSTVFSTDSSAVREMSCVQEIGGTAEAAALHNPLIQASRDA